MNILVAQLIYGNRPHNILIDNELKAGYPAIYCSINTEGIANAMNEGIDYMLENSFDAIAFLSNDIIEPQDWLAKKVDAMQTYPSAGIISTSVETICTQIISQVIIGNYLISHNTIKKIGYFNESMFPYGPIDIDYCHRCDAAGIKTYYLLDAMAQHIGSHASGNEYGWDKEKLVNDGWDKVYKSGNYYKSKNNAI